MKLKAYCDGERQQIQMFAVNWWCICIVAVTKLSYRKTSAKLEFFHHKMLQLFSKLSWISIRLNN